MIEIIVVVLLCLHIGKIAKRKGLQPGIWRFYTVLAWIVAEMIGIGIAVFVLNSRDLLGLMFMGLICAVGGYLLVKSILDKKPDHVEDDIDRIGTDDLRP